MRISIALQIQNWHNELVNSCLVHVAVALTQFQCYMKNALLYPVITRYVEAQLVHKKCAGFQGISQVFLIRISIALQIQNWHNEHVNSCLVHVAVALTQFH